MSKPIDIVSAEFGEKYQLAKASVTKKDEAQKELFAAFDQAMKDEEIPRRSVLVPDGQEIEAYIDLHHPGWIIESVTDRNVILKENPSLRAYTYPNHADRMVYGRDVIEESPSLDDDRLRADDPDLWDRISTWPEPWYSLLKDALGKYIPERYNDLDAMVDEYLSGCNLPRVLSAPESWTDNDLAQVQEYMIPGKVKVRLRPPRKAKAEDLTQ